MLKCALCYGKVVWSLNNSQKKPSAKLSHSHSTLNILVQKKRFLIRSDTKSNIHFSYLKKTQKSVDCQGLLCKEQ